MTPNRLPVKAFLPLLLCLATSCYRHVVHLPPGPVNISGQVVDAKGAPIANDEVFLFRHLKYIGTRTNAAGQYTFPGVAAASYVVEAWGDHCNFVPQRTWLGNVAANAVESFEGIGMACGGEPTVNIGGTTGPYSISGHARDGAGQPIVGARIDLVRADDEVDGVEAVRFTDVNGSYSMSVRNDVYDLRISGPCSFTPSRIHIEQIHASLAQNFVGGSGCQTESQNSVNPTGSVFTMKQGGDTIGTTYVRVEQRASAADAQARLVEIEKEQPSVAFTLLTIAGYPAIERQATVKLPGLDRDADSSGGSSQPFLAITTAIADGSIVVRYESQLSASASAATIALFVQIGRNFNPNNLNELHGPPASTTPTQPSPAAPSHPITGLLLPGNMDPADFGELQIGASDVANAVVYGTQNAPFVSTNGGQTVNPSTYNFVNPPSATKTGAFGDPTVTVGAIYGTTKQDIYFVQEEQTAPAPTPANLIVIATGLYKSTDNGQTFNNVSFPVNCGSASFGCAVPDQEQLVADRLNRAVTSSGTADQLYMTWRNFPNPSNGTREIGVACSKDGGQNWQTDVTTLNVTGGDFGRPAVAPDGSLLVVFELFGSPSTLEVQKWSSCASGFTPAPGSPGTLASINDVANMPGLDRSPDGEYSLAFDSSDSSGKTVFGVYSNEATPGNDDIHGAESVDGGQTWSRDSIVSTSSNGHRYFPWLCSSAGKYFVTWYDRRHSTSAKPDLTAYYRSSIFDNGTTTSVGIGTEKNVSGVDDPECASGFVSGVSSPVEEAGCKNLPSGLVPGGACQSKCAPGRAGPCGSGAACDFRAATPCTTSGETCTTTRGQPKFGDYNGAACSQGILYMAWASSTAPSGGGCLLNGVSSSNASKCCSGQLSGSICAATSSTSCTANGGTCGGSLPKCCSNIGANGQCQANTCLPAIGLYTSSTCIGPACAGLPVQINYHQVGACNGYGTGSGLISAGPNQAFVIYRIDSIDNSGGTSPFNFNPGNSYVQQINPSALDTTVSMAQIFGLFAAVSNTVNAGQDYQLSTGEYVAITAQTNASDGASEADGRFYPLSYKRGSSDPPVSVVNENPGQTSWPYTPDCSTVYLH
jgi:hypothetical protein